MTKFYEDLLLYEDLYEDLGIYEDLWNLVDLSRCP